MLAPAFFYKNSVVLETTLHSDGTMMVSVVRAEHKPRKNDGMPRINAGSRFDLRISRSENPARYSNNQGFSPRLPILAARLDLLSRELHARRIP